MNQDNRWIDYPGTRADVYERYLVPAIFGPFAVDLLDRSGMRPGHRVLDVACGTGVVARLAVERVGAAGTVAGLDVNAGMLAVARALDADSRVDWREASALAMPFADVWFDVVLCQQGLQSFPDRTAGLREMRRVLRPGGRVALSVWGAVERCPAYAVLAESVGRVIGPAAAALPPFALSDTATLERLLNDAGFGAVAVSSATRTVRFPSAVAFVSQVAGGAPTMLGALAEADAPARGAVLDAALGGLARFADGDGLAFPIEWLCAVARQ